MKNECLICGASLKCLENVVCFINKYIDSFASMEQRHGRQRSRAAPIIAKG